MFGRLLVEIREEGLQMSEKKEMTREEAIKVLNNFPIDFRNSGGFEAMEALKIAILALRPVSREQVERIWFREPYTRLETKCGENGDVVYSAVNTCMACGHETPIGNFCHNCGAAQTREAVQMVMERLEALHENIYNG